MTEEVIYEIKRAIMDVTGEFHKDDVFHALNELVMMIVCDSMGGKKMSIADFYRRMATEWDAQHGPLH